MIKRLGNLSINRKLLLILLFSSLMSLFFAGVFLIWLELSEFQRTTKEDLTALASVIGNRSAAALMFDDRNLAVENLAVFNNIPAVQLTCLYRDPNTVFVGLANKTDSSQICQATIVGEKNRFENKQLIVINPIMMDKEQIGIVYIRADLSKAYWQKIKFIGVLLLVLVAVSLLAFLLSQPLLKLISTPVKKLVDTVKKINDTGDYSLRAEKLGNDEMGVLVDSFNGLIKTVEAQSLALTRAKNRYLTLYDDNPTMVFNISREGVILSVNLTGAKQLGLTVEELQSCSLFDFVHSDDASLMRELIERCNANPLQVHNHEMRNICHNARIIWVRATARLVENEVQESSLLIVYEDITETRLLNEQIAYQADHDALTGLANRNKFDRYLKRAITLAQQHSSEHALCYLDLDQFKVVNDTCGHLAGDELLRQLGDMLRKHVRQSDFIARLGGDEFGILMYNCSPQQALLACEKLRELIKDFTFAWEDRSFTIGVSIGVAPISIVCGNAVDLLKEADAACYAAKEKGRNRVHLFSPDDEELAIRQGEMQWVEKIRSGLERQRFILYGQPIVPLHDTDEGLHFEALLRYRDDRGNIIPPGAFLPAAERYNLASELDRWIISNLLEWLATRPDFLSTLSLCSVNLSGLSLSDESMLKFISSQFQQWNVPTNKLCFEITETAAISNLSHATHFINQLKEQGCLFSLDDFGSGLSSFAYLKHLPVDYLKIDGLFVKDILVDEVDLAMVKSINEVGHVMNKKTIAEFVENEAIFNLLKKLGIDYAQGYGIGKPVPLDELKSITTLFDSM
ncbi:diguanylate cyclase/phosphodiesterase with PAS/PAC sensor(S) [Methyloglobulus morosus KoM1]|uniref:Diguanylate cyclase/phosphodiesterase with PAS/PAC sensor(S) n=1 Tax=Methyloglobulus morosus KoM1 TaxID=1116472 RepID=V5C2F8_9GAMM|nr:EAL domain-containing protein [Methyloglobulus morosus]ESS70988.1 diguanylate cyclase/phosphodiesterase with PAS/PAC sensor(S) [Methyloglobulus morosus KoM1]